VLNGRWAEEGLASSAAAERRSNASQHRPTHANTLHSAPAALLWPAQQQPHPCTCGITIPPFQHRHSHPHGTTNSPTCTVADHSKHCHPHPVKQYHSAPAALPWPAPQLPGGCTLLGMRGPAPVPDGAGRHPACPPLQMPLCWLPGAGPPQQPAHRGRGIGRSSERAVWVGLHAALSLQGMGGRAGGRVGGQVGRHGLACAQTFAACPVMSPKPLTGSRYVSPHYC